MFIYLLFILNKIVKCTFGSKLLAGYYFFSRRVKNVNIIFSLRNVVKFQDNFKKNKNKERFHCGSFGGIFKTQTPKGEIEVTLRDVWVKPKINTYGRGIEMVKNRA